MTARRMRLVVLGALACGAGVVALVLSSDHQDAQPVWAILGPTVGWSFVGTGLYAWRRRPESRTGELMVWFGFAWFVAALHFADSALLYSIAFVAGGLWGGVFLHLIMAFPSGRLRPGLDRALVIAGYLVFTVAAIPTMLFAGPSEVGCDDCPTNVLLIRRDADLASIASGFEGALYAALFVIVLVRLTGRWRETPTLERLQLTPVYVCGLLTFLLVTAGTAGGAVATNPVWWAAFAVTAALPAAFLAGLLRSHVARLDAELRARLEDLRASRARLVEAGDVARRRLERDLHDGAQQRLVTLTLALGMARSRVAGVDPELEGLIEAAGKEAKEALTELRELARGIHPAVLTETGLAGAIQALVERSPAVVTITEVPRERFPAVIEATAYFVVSEALANVAKHARAGTAQVSIRRLPGRLAVRVSDDGAGGARPERGSGLAGLADRVASAGGVLRVDSPPGAGTTLEADIPCP